MSINILIVDDQQIIRDGLQSLLETESSFHVVGQAGNGKEALSVLNELQVDVVLMDIRMPLMNGVETTKIVKQQFPNIKVIILTTFDDDDFILEAMSNGASGYLLKDTNSEQLFQAIQDSVKGSIILHGEIAIKNVTHI